MPEIGEVVVCVLEPMWRNCDYGKDDLGLLGGTVRGV